MRVFSRLFMASSIFVVISLVAQGATRPKPALPTGPQKAIPQESTKKKVQTKIKEFWKATTEVLGFNQNSGDYLKDVKEPPKEKNISEFLFDRQMSLEMSERYRSYNEPYQFRQHYQQNGQYESNNFENQNKEMADWTVKRLFDYHVDKFVKDPPKESAAAQTMSRAVKTVQAVQNPSVQVSPETKAKMRFDVPNGLVHAQVTSPLVDTSVDYRTRPLIVTQGFGPEPSEPLYVGASRSFDMLKASTSVTYGVQNDTLSYHIHKDLVGNLSASFQENQYRREPSRDETVVRLNYGTTLDKLFPDKR